MPALNFPDSPSLNDFFVSNGRRWQWNGVAWQRIPDPGAQGVQGAPGTPGGAQGVQGNQGVQGAQGNTGGAQGHQGVPGSATSSAPTFAGDTGAPGTIAFDADFIYVCVASNTWKRAAISTWS